MKRDVRVVLKSSDATFANNGTYVYNIDWSAILENEPYLMSYTFITEAYSIGTNTTSGVLTVNFAASNITDLSSMRTGANSSSTVIGFTSAIFSPVLGIMIAPRGINGAGFMMSKSTFNPDHYLERRPCSNTFILSMRNVLVSTANSPNTAVKHMVILNFKPVK